MSLLTRAEFVKITWLGSHHIPHYKKLGKIVSVIHDDKEFFDTSLELNRKFIIERKEKIERGLLKEPKPIESKKKKKPEDGPKIGRIKRVQIKPRPEPKTKKVKEQDHDHDPEEFETNQAEASIDKHRKFIETDEEKQEVTGIFDLDKQIKKAQLVKIKEETEKTRLSNEKLRGQTIPTELVKSLFAQHNMSMVQQFNNVASDMITTFSHRKQLSVDEIADLKSYLRKAINGAVDEAAEQTQKSIKRIIEEFSIKKGRGQR